MRQAGAALRCGARASHCSGLMASCGGARALGVQTSVVAAHRLGSCGTWALEHTGFSSCGTRALEHAGFSSCGARAQ